jgi:hypothetical protein
MRSAIRKILPSALLRSNMPRLPGYRDLEKLMVQAQRLSSSTAPEVATLCKRMRTDLRALEERTLKDWVGSAALTANLFMEFWAFTELVRDWLGGQVESEDDAEFEAPSSLKTGKKGRR